ncbi:PREDICTED: mucin-7-like [Diuraphis noxia]|uniref:mucin-7-like n=1 Tax=Diuraphis noxia TaxID=143948 RepID=UPI000763AB77|nr:PREDICTED: mucin-7-like [Diuraphis noxia]
MGQNYENAQSCGSVRCCCKLISKCEEKSPAAVVATKPQNNVVDGSSERSQISLCDFLNLHSIPKWIKINDARPQQHRNQQRPMQPSTTDQPKESNTPEDLQSSQIIINFGTVVTNGVSKRDSGQQTDPEVQQQANPTTVIPPTNRSTSTCPTAAKRSMPNGPPADPPSSKCPSSDRSTSKSPPSADQFASKCPPADRSTSKCPPADRSTSKCPPVDRPASICPVPTAEPPAAAPARDRCSNREKAPSAAVSSSPSKARTEPVVKKNKCGCNCHSDV